MLNGTRSAGSVLAAPFLIPMPMPASRKPPLRGPLPPLPFMTRMVKEYHPSAGALKVPEVRTL